MLAAERCRAVGTGCLTDAAGVIAEGRRMRHQNECSSHEVECCSCCLLPEGEDGNWKGDRKTHRSSRRAASGSSQRSFSACAPHRPCGTRNSDNLLSAGDAHAKKAVRSGGASAESLSLGLCRPCQECNTTHHAFAASSGVLKCPRDFLCSQTSIGPQPPRRWSAKDRRCAMTGVGETRVRTVLRRQTASPSTLFLVGTRL